MCYDVRNMRIDAYIKSAYDRVNAIYQGVTLMAIVPGRWFLMVNLIDNGRNITSRRFQLVVDEEAEDPALDASSAATAFIAAYMATTDAALVSHFHYQEHIEDALVIPASGVQIEDNALLLFSIDGYPQKTATMAIPAPKPTIFNATSGAGANIIDTADAAVMALRDTMLANSDPLVYLSDGELVDGLISGKRIHRASRRG